MALLFQLSQKLAQGFEDFWAIWVRKEAKLDAKKAWNQKVTTPEIEDKVFKAMEWQGPIFMQRETQFRPLAATWLRGERWEDEPPQPPTPPKPKTISPAIVKPITTMAEQQLDARNRIRSLVAAGVDPEDAKDQVFKELGWRK